MLKFKPSIRTGKKGDLSDFKRGMVVGARRAGIMSLDFCCDIQMVGSEFGVKNMKHGSILPCLNVSGCWWRCNGVGEIFLYQIEHCLNATANLSIDADHVLRFMTTVYTSSDVLPAG